MIIVDMVSLLSITGAVHSTFYPLNVCKSNVIIGGRFLSKASAEKLDRKSGIMSVSGRAEENCLIQIVEIMPCSS